MSNNLPGNLPGGIPQATTPQGPLPAAGLTPVTDGHGHYILQAVAAQVAFHGTTATATTLPNNGDNVIVPISAIQYDTASAYSVSTHLFTVPVDGKYILTAQASGPGVALVVDQLRGASSIYTAQSEPGPPAALSDVFDCTAGDTLQLLAFDQNAGSGAGLLTNAVLTITRVSS